MTRKKVTTETIKSETPKKRVVKPRSKVVNTPKPKVVEPEKKKSAIIPDDGKPTKWDKVKGINGKIVRYKMGDQERAVEIGKLVQQGKARSLYVSADGNIMYFYYEIMKE